MTKQEEKWQAESDARTLAQAEEIRHDKNRLKAATTAAKRLLKEEVKEVKGLAVVAGKIDWDDDEQCEKEWKRRKGIAD
jgi:hypothetical protein